MRKKQSNIVMGDITKAMVVGLLGAIVFGPLGYFINDYLSKDNIDIISINFIPEVNLFNLEQNDYDDLFDKTSLKLYKNWYLYELLNKATHEYNKIDSSKIITIEKGLNMSQLNNLIIYINNWRIYVGSFDEYIKRLKEYTDGDNINDIISNSNISGVSTIYLSDAKNAIDMLIKYYEDIKTSYPNEHVIVSKLMKDIKDYKQTRTGMLKINVALLNSGNSDGIIRRDGILTLIDEGRHVKIKMTDINIIPKIEKRSILQVSFEIDQDQSKPDDVDVLKETLVHHLASQVSLELYDIRNNPIASRNSPLPIRHTAQ